MEMMIKHHGKAIKEGRHRRDKAEHAELRTLTRSQGNRLRLYKYRHGCASGTAGVAADHLRYF